MAENVKIALRCVAKSPVAKTIPAHNTGYYTMSRVGKIGADGD